MHRSARRYWPDHRQPRPTPRRIGRERPTWAGYCRHSDRRLGERFQRFTWKEIAGKIKHQTDTYKWIFLFLGANQDAIATAANLSIAANNAANYVADAAGSKAGQAAFSRKMSALRRASMDIASGSERLDAEAPLTQIVSEEDRKSREPSENHRTTDR